MKEVDEDELAENLLADDLIFDATNFPYLPRKIL